MLKKVKETNTYKEVLKKFPDANLLDVIKENEEEI